MLSSLKTRAVGQADRLLTPRAQRRAALLMLGTAAIGLIVAVVGTIVTWRLIGSVNSATADTLDVTIEALDSVEDTIDVADGMVDSTSEALDGLETTMLTLGTSLDSGAAVVDDTSQLTETAGPALADATATLRQLEGVGAGIDGLLEGLTNIPFSPSFDPEAGLGSTFGRLADDLEPLPVLFEESAESLGTFESTLGRLESDVGTLAETIAGVNERLGESDDLLAQYQENVSRAKVVAEGSRNDLSRDQSQLRLVVIVAGLNFAAAQIVPLWLGAELLTRLRREDD